MFTNFLRKLGVAGLQVARMLLYVVSAPFGLLMTVYGVYFIVVGFAWLVVFAAAFYSALLIFVANFYMAFVALFAPSLWDTMGSMWSWLGSWFASGHAALWPHIVKSFPPYFGAGIVFMIIINFTEYLKRKATAVQAQYANP